MEHLTNLETVYQGRIFSVKTGTLLTKNGKQIQRDMVAHPGATVILPFVEDHHILMIRNQRYPIEKELWELPAGCVNVGELPRETAKRELIEETGYQAGHMDFLLNFYTSPGFCNEIIYAFVARDLTFVGQALEEGENIVVEKIAFSKAIDMIQHGAIEDAKTLISLMYFKNFKLI